MDYSWKYLVWKCRKWQGAKLEMHALFCFLMEKISAGKDAELNGLDAAFTIFLKNENAFLTDFWHFAFDPFREVPVCEFYGFWLREWRKGH